MKKIHTHTLLAFGLVGLAIGACGQSDSTKTSTGGTTATSAGGTVASSSGSGSGGSVTASSGTTATGGSAKTGGSSSTGGTSATSGVASGGTKSTGGTLGTGGSSATGGSATGGSAKGGSSTGGSATGGSSTGGSATRTDGGIATGPDGGTGTSGVTVLLAGDNVNANGPLQTKVEDLTFSGGGHILVRPATITKEPNTKHPVAIWGPGGGTPPRDYLTLLTRMASQGFVVVGIRESSGGSELMSAAIDWLEKQNADSISPMFDRLILNRVGVFGHSMGGLSSEATIRADKRVTTALLDNSGDLSQKGLVGVQAPVGIIYGEDGMERPNAEGDYNNAGNKGPCWLGMMAKGGHGSGPWDGAGANVAWMRWHIGGENSRKAAFLGTGGDYNNRGIWTTKSKNWDGWKNWNE